MYPLIYLKICQELICYMGRGDVPPALTVFSDSLGVIYGLSVVHCLSSSSARVGFPDSSVSKESTCNAGDPGSIPGSGRSAGERKGYPLQYSWASLVAQLVKNPPAMRETWVGKTPGERKEYLLQYSGLENSMDHIIHGVTKSWTRLSNFHFHPQQK